MAHTTAESRVGGIGDKGSRPVYATTNFKTKAALKAAVKEGKDIGVCQPNDMGIVPPVVNGTAYLEGPWYPEPHRWYAQATVKDGRIVGVK